ncbi:hypothetical protein Taro_016415 [Colocasia esculenta]|uniref:Uncharacterized protein n=1 Tax=Colocasia esculenta TaxID=4460 RepID=A0A843UNG1_COLES|nr:hypothetical protein [Colocasia esculenta]
MPPGPSLPMAPERPMQPHLLLSPPSSSSTSAFFPSSASTRFSDAFSWTDLTRSDPTVSGDLKSLPHRTGTSDLYGSKSNTFKIVDPMVQNSGLPVVSVSKSMDTHGFQKPEASICNRSNASKGRNERKDIKKGEGRQVPGSTMLPDVDNKLHLESMSNGSDIEYQHIAFAAESNYLLFPGWG